MTANSGSNGDRHGFTEDQMAMIGDNLEELRPWLSEERLLRSLLATGFALGLVAHAAGYVLRVTVSGEPFLFLADLLYGLGLSLWTGIVVVAFVQVYPKAKRRELKRMIDAYEAKRREQSGS